MHERSTDYGDYVTAATESVDLVSSWTALNGVLRDLELENYDDERKLELFKHTVKEINRMLTRARNALLKCDGIDSAIDYLSSQMKGNIDSIEDLLYQSYKQAWIRQVAQDLSEMQQLDDILDIIDKEE